MTDDEVIRKIQEINQSTYRGRLDWYERLRLGQNFLEANDFRPVQAGKLVVLVKDGATVSFTFGRGEQVWSIHQ